MSSERVPANHDEPRSILIENTAWSPNTDPFFREDEIPEINQVLTEFFSESHVPSYIINSTQDTDVDPQDGAIAGPSGLCRKRSLKDKAPTSAKNQTEHHDCELHEQMSYDDEQEDVTSKSRGKQPMKRKKNIRIAPSKKCKISPPKLTSSGAENSTSTSNATEEGRYPRRRIPRVNYREEEDLPHDSEIMCDKCGIMYNGDCPLHDNLLPIGDRGSPQSCW